MGTRGAGTGEMGVTEAQAMPPPRTREERARELIEAAQLQIGDLASLQDMQAASTDGAQKAAIDREIATVSRLRDAVLADLPDRATNTERFDVDIWRLEREMQSAAAIRPAPLGAPPIERHDGTPGGGNELLPAYR